MADAWQHGAYAGQNRSVSDGVDGQDKPGHDEKLDAWHGADRLLAGSELPQQRH